MGFLGDSIAWGISGAIVNAQARNEEITEDFREAAEERREQKKKDKVSAKINERLNIDWDSFEQFGLSEKVYKIDNDPDDGDITINLHVYGNPENEHHMVSVKLIAYNEMNIPVKSLSQLVFTDEELNEVNFYMYDLKELPASFRVYVKQL